jgi:hypothetical protein
MNEGRPLPKSELPKTRCMLLNSSKCRHIPVATKKEMRAVSAGSFMVRRELETMK